MKYDAPKSKQVDGADPDEPEDVRQVEKQGDDGPPPPDIVETDTETTPAELEYARKKYLLRRSGSVRADFGAGAATKSPGRFRSGSWRSSILIWIRGLFDAIEQRNGPMVYSSKENAIE